jgi:ankyrin repeat protein
LIYYLDDTYNWNIYHDEEKEIYAKNKNGYTPYLSAARHGFLEIMKYLEEKHNWDVFAKTNYGYNGKSAYYYAQSKNHYHIMNYLKNTHNWCPISNLKDKTTQGIY